jgi:hypothetical protein
MSNPSLIIGNKNYSLCSLRLWLYIKQPDMDFKKIRIPLSFPKQFNSSNT